VCRHGDYGSEYLLDELPFFQPKEGLYLVEPEKQAGIHCRFGMKGETFFHDYFGVFVPYLFNAPLTS
jgi:hypothetical protein